MCFIISLGQCTIIVKIKNVKIIYVKDLLNDRVFVFKIIVTTLI